VRTRLFWVALSLALLVALLLPAAALAVPSFDQAVDKLVQKGYPQKIEDDLTSFGTNPDLGFAFAGSSSDDDAARYIARELRASGFVNVRLEPVPVDEWGFTHASVAYQTTDGKVVLQASTFGGVAPTPLGGITASVVYVGAGTKADFDAAGPVAGKIVLIDALLGTYWMDWPFREAELHDAAAVIYRSVPWDLSYYGEPAALGSMDCQYNYPGVPVVHISQLSGAQLFDAMAAGPLTVTVRNEVDVRLAEDGGTGYNVYAEYPGGDPKGETVLMMAHHDFFFRAGLDDNGAVACLLTTAKALRQSGYRPDGKLAVLVTTAEEYGRASSYYDWLIGSWWAITQAHPDWPGKLAGVMNYELMAMKGQPVLVRVNPELRTLLKDLAANEPALVPYSYTVGDVYCWNDQWPFTAAGVPSVYFRARTGEMLSKWYHTQYDTVALQDWQYLGQLAKFSQRFIRSFDQGLLPYDLKGRADQLAGTVDATELLDAGVSPARVTRLTNDVATFQAEAQAFNDDRGSIPASQVRSVNKALMAIEVDVNSAFTALDCWDVTIYPHQQVLWDIQYLDAALAALQDPVDDDAALSAMTSVGINFYGPPFSYENYLYALERHDPDYPALYWGAQGHLAPYLDVMPSYWNVKAGNYDVASAALSGQRADEVAELNARIDEMCDVIEDVIPQIQALH
jgi:hypothetical protein